MRYCAAFAILICFSAVGFCQTTWYVPDDFSTIQAAIADASVVDHDTVMVRAGTYFENVDLLDKAIALKSEDGPGATRIDGQQAGSVVTLTDNSDPFTSLEGFTLTNGTNLRGGGVHIRSSAISIIDCVIISNSAQEDGGGAYINGSSSVIIADSRFASNAGTDLLSCGGALYAGVEVSDLTVSNTLFEQNQSYAGGAVFCWCNGLSMADCAFTLNAAIFGGGLYDSAGGTVIENCLFENNACDSDAGLGGGAYLGTGSSDFLDSTFLNNSARNGGAIYRHNAGEVLLDNCQFQGNSATAEGGAIRLRGIAEIENCSFESNMADTGGAFFCHGVNPLRCDSCEFVDNHADTYGGAVYHWFSMESAFSNAHFTRNTAGSGAAIYNREAGFTITNSIVSDNEAVDGGGGGFFSYTADEIVVANCTLTGNSSSTTAGGIYCYMTSLVIVNSILWGDSPVELTCNSSPHNVSFSCIEGDWPGPGNVDADPLFIDAASGDYHLDYNSPCRETGNNNTPWLAEEDFEGDPRVEYTAVDMGADEFHTHLYCMGDFTPNGTIEGKFVGQPGTWPVGLFIGSGLMDPPMQHAWGEFHLESPWILLPLVSIPSGGVLTIPATLPSTPAQYMIPMQALVGGDLSNLFILEVE